jgi:hypothetical protein
MLLPITYSVIITTVHVSTTKAYLKYSVSAFDTAQRRQQLENSTELLVSHANQVHSAVCVHMLA